LLGWLADRSPETDGRPQQRPRSFSAAGLVLLRTPPERGHEIWCRCDGGPHGFLSIAAHAHADALSLEVRHDGVDILADPGTYCYHGEREWRRYFRSTRAHNTICIDGRDQSVSGGPFMWTKHAHSVSLRDEAIGNGDQAWAAAQDGYKALPGGGVRHQRVVRLRADEHSLVVTDLVRGHGRHQVELLFHLGPDVSAHLDGGHALLTWPARGATLDATLTLPQELIWSAHRGETDPVLGWYSPGFGDRVPSTTLVGVGVVDGCLTLCTELTFRECLAPTPHARGVGR
jgi:hypothetical protein